ncbi:MAG: hypothetical protein KC588_16485 [Nitrospira sp.]|nr:hypothetical protein [Nitrospira sp.]
MSPPNQRGFFDLAIRYDTLSQQRDTLERLAQHTPWARFRPTLGKPLRRSNRQKGTVEEWDMSPLMRR